VLVALLEQQRLQTEQQRVQTEQLRVQNEQLRVQNEQQRVQGQLMVQLVSLLPPLQREAQHARLRRLDPWTSAQRTRVEQAAFKARLLHHYERGAPDNPPDKPWARCMVSGAELPQPLVKASHIWKRSTQGEGLDEFGLRATDVHSVRNGLLLASQLEAAFDVKRVAFRYNLLRDEFTLCLLDPALLGGARVVSDAEVRELRGYPPLERVPTFRDCDGAVLQCPPDCKPFRRLLAWHYALAMKHAAAEEWVALDAGEGAEAEARTVLLGSPDGVWPQAELMAAYDHAAAASDRDGDSDSDSS
jgi:hypothetical protein